MALQKRHRFKRLAALELPKGFCRKVRFLGKIQKSGVRNSISQGQIPRTLASFGMNLRSENLRFSDFQGEAPY